MATSKRSTKKSSSTRRRLQTALSSNNRRSLLPTLASLKVLSNGRGRRMYNGALRSIRRRPLISLGTAAVAISAVSGLVLMLKPKRHNFMSIFYKK